MSFTFHHGCEDAAKTVNSLIRYNKGVWKSTKQRDFALAKILPYADSCFPRNQENAVMFGVEMERGSGLVIEGETRWADYGRKSYRRCGWYYVIDDVGVVAQYKLHYSYDDRTGSSGVNQKKTELMWKREDGLTAPEPVIEIRPETFHVGNVGQRMKCLLMQTASIDKGIGQWGREMLTIWKDENGNLFYYNNDMYSCSQEQCERGIEVSFTIKKHIVTKKGDKATVIGRMALSKEQKLLNIMSE